MDFIRSTSEKVKLWRVEHFFPRFFPGQCWLVEITAFTNLVMDFFVKNKFSTNQHWSGKKRGKKVFNSSEFHFFGSTSYEIHILVTHFSTRDFTVNKMCSFLHIHMEACKGIPLASGIQTYDHRRKTPLRTKVQVHVECQT